jgi:hypothetical protein
MFRIFWFGEHKVTYTLTASFHILSFVQRRPEASKNVKNIIVPIFQQWLCLQLNENWEVYHMFTKELVRIVVGKKKVWNKNNAYRLNLPLGVLCCDQ